MKKRRINITIDESMYQIIKQKAESDGISVSYLLQDSAIDRVLGYESDRVQAILEQYSAKLSKILQQKGLDEAKQIENILFMSFFNDLPNVLGSLQNRDYDVRMLAESEKTVKYSIDRAYQNGLITKEQHKELLKEVAE